MIMGIPLYLTDYRELIDTRGRLSAEISAVIFQQKAQISGANGNR
jgi:hypothetical protein